MEQIFTRSIKIGGVLNYKASKFSLVTGERNNSNQIKHQQNVGYTLKIEGNDYYLVKIFFFDKYFFLVKDDSNAITYTIYSRHDENKNIFKHPVGRARIDKNLKSYIELYFPVLNQIFYMNLFPVKK